MSTEINNIYTLIARECMLDLINHIDDDFVYIPCHSVANASALIYALNNQDIVISDPSIVNPMFTKRSNIDYDINHSYFYIIESSLYIKYKTFKNNLTENA